MKQVQFVSVTPVELTEIITAKVSEVIGNEFEKIIQKHLQQNKEKEYVTRQEAAEMLSLSYSGLYKLVKKENVPIHKVGRKPYYKRQDILDILEYSPI